MQYFFYRDFVVIYLYCSVTLTIFQINKVKKSLALHESCISQEFLMLKVDV